VSSYDVFQRRTLEREVDPIIMKYRDDNKEAEFQKTMSSRTKVKVDKMAGQQFNIITHQGHKPKAAPAERIIRGTRSYNLLSHYPTRFHKTAPVEFDEGYYLAVSRPVKDEANAPVHRGREFNVLSNKYNTNHEERALRDHEAVQEHMREIYWRTHIFDPVRGEMYDEEKDNALREADAKKIAAKMKRQQDMLPPRYQSAEGKTYNIVSQQITNPTKFSTIQDKSLHRYKGREEILMNTTMRSMEKMKMEEERKLNRISFERYKETIDRGYDFVFADAKLSLKPLPQRPGTVWDRMPERSASSSRHRDLSGTALSPAKSASNLYASSSSSPEPFASSGRLQTRDVQSATATTRSSAPVPALDMTRAHAGTPVSYQEPVGGAPGQPVPMVRTGGLAAMGSKTMAMSPY
jgi:hypothetical protein